MPRSKRTIGLAELRVGIFVLVAIVVLIILVLNASGDLNPFKRKLHLRARFASADGLRPGSDVKLAGVKVGRVDSIRLLSAEQGPKNVEVMLALYDTIDGRPATERVRTDSVAQLSVQSLLGNDKLINITPGTPAGNPVTEGFTLESITAGGFDQFADTGNDLMKRLTKVSDEINEIARKVNAGEGTMGRIINDPRLYENLNASITEAKDLITRIREGEGSAGRFVNDPSVYNNIKQISEDIEVISRNLRAGKGTAGKLLTDEELYNKARSSIARLDESIDQINAMITDVRAGKGTMGRLMTDEALYNDVRTAVNRFNTTAERIDNVVAAAQRGEGTVGRLLTDDSLYSNVNQFSSEAVKMLYDFRQNPKKYLTIKFQLF